MHTHTLFYLFPVFILSDSVPFVVVVVVIVVVIVVVVVTRNTVDRNYQVRVSNEKSEQSL